MRHYVLNFSDCFRETVMERFVRSYEQGATPNPCIDCNRYLKFAKLFRRARELDFDLIATGHYARVEYDAASGRYLLKKGLDIDKDQSYVLYCLTQEQLSRTRFPLGSLHKAEVREIAAAQGFINARKRDSQDQILSGLPVFGTCAGLLLLAREIDNDRCRHLATMDITAVRNAYGRQLGSFFAEADFRGAGKIPMTFIRAPYIRSVSGNAEVLAQVDGKIVAARQGRQLVTAFHPELSGNLSVHRYFLEQLIS